MAHKGTKGGNKTTGPKEKVKSVIMGMYAEYPEMFEKLPEEKSSVTVSGPEEKVKSVVMEMYKEYPDMFQMRQPISEENAPLDEQIQDSVSLQAENKKLRETVAALVEALRLFHISGKCSSCRAEVTEKEFNGDSDGDSDRPDL